MTTMQPVLTHSRNVTLIALGVCLLALVVHRFGWLDVVELKSLDYRFRHLSVPSYAHQDIVLVTVDEASLEAIGRWPWPRDLHGYAVKFLKDAGARVIAFDILFLEPDLHDPEYDDVFAREVSAAGNVFLASLLHEGNGLPPYRARAGSPIPSGEPARNAYFAMKSVKYPIPSVGKASQGISFVNLTPDADGTTRSIPLFGRAGDVVVPALSMLVANAIVENQEFRFEGNDLLWGRARIPLLGNGRFLINWHGLAERVIRVGAVQRSET